MEVSSQSVDAFVEGVQDQQRQADTKALVRIMREETGITPVMWGSNIIGFGTMHYKYETGREGDTVVVGFSPRKQALVLYGVIFYDQNLKQAEKLGKYKAGKGCLYIKKLSDIDENVLRQMISEAYKIRSAVRTHA